MDVLTHHLKRGIKFMSGHRWCSQRFISRRITLGHGYKSHANSGWVIQPAVLQTSILHIPIQGIYNSSSRYYSTLTFTHLRRYRQNVPVATHAVALTLFLYRGLGDMGQSNGHPQGSEYKPTFQVAKSKFIYIILVSFLNSHHPFPTTVNTSLNFFPWIVGRHAQQEHKPLPASGLQAGWVQRTHQRRKRSWCHIFSGWCLRHRHPSVVLQEASSVDNI